jgi:galactose mutarotase-like enzyme
MAVEVFGALPDGGAVRRLVLGEEPGPVLHVLDLGATVHRLEVTGGDGQRRNVVLGHVSPQDYLASTDYFGGTIGRYANRIAAGRFRLDDDDVVLRTHDRGNHLHGGPDGFDRRMWNVVEHDPFRAVLALHSPHGDQGFPGNLDATVSFDVSADRVRIAFEATTDAPTVVNLTNHAYFNLDGEGSGTVDDHDLQVSADLYTPVDGSGIPLGGHASVSGTPFDFRQPIPIGSAVRDGHEQVALARGIDHNYVIKDSGWRLAAALTSRGTDTSLQLFTDQPGLQVYSGNFLDGTRSSTTGRLYRQGDGIALEPQVYPDAPNRPDYPSTVLRPGQTYRVGMEWRFTPHESPRRH